MPYIEVQNISKKFEDSIAIEDISFTLNQGELLTLLGPSGSGKTTILKLIAGLLQPDTGKILFDGKDVSQIKTENRNIGFVFQSYALFPHLTVIENIAFGLETRNWSKEKKTERIKELLKLVGLTGKGKRSPRELSGGEQSRVALARAIAPNPTLLLLDEPLSALDIALKETLRSAIREIQQETGISTIYVTHDQKEAMEISDRIIILDNGRIIEQGKPKELYLLPKHKFTAKFLGISNVLSGKVHLKDHNYLLIAPFGQLYLPENNYELAKEISIAIYPEYITLSNNSKNRENEFKATISKVLFHGSTIELHLQISNTTLEVRLTSSKENQNYKKNDQIFLSIPRKAILYLKK